MRIKTYEPGSEAAFEQGCLCKVDQDQIYHTFSHPNGGRRSVYVVNAYCPWHGFESWDAKVDLARKKANAFFSGEAA